MIRIDAVWLAVEPLDMRAGTDTALARVVRVFGEARALQKRIPALRGQLAVAVCAEPQALVGCGAR